MSENQVDLEEFRLCSKCVGEPYLRAEIENSGRQAQCTYCEEAGMTFTCGEVATKVQQAIEEHYEITDPDSEWMRDGASVLVVIADGAEIPESAAEDIRQILSDRTDDHERYKTGEEGPFDESTYYTEKSVDGWEYHQLWDSFERQLKSEARFFSRSGHQTLSEIFAGLTNLLTHENEPVVIEAGPGLQITHFFRARVFQSEEKLKDALKRPDVEIGPPPTLHAAPGRMNAKGISIFYGATDETTALNEVRPPTGSHVITGNFVLTRKVRLLNVTALAGVHVKGSIFDPSYLPALERASFLRRLSSRITRAVMPDDEPFEYLPTQAVADFLSSVMELNGVLYESVQSGGATANVALFHPAARVEKYTVPKGTEIEAYIHLSTEEGNESDFSVHETVPTDATEPERKTHELLLTPLNFPVEPLDDRIVTLRLVLDSMKVHKIQSVKVNPATFPVRRHRW